MNIYMLQICNDMRKAVKAETPEEAIKLYMKYYCLPEEGWQRQQISVTYVSTNIITNKI